MNKLKDALDSRLKDITFSQQMKNKVLEDCKQSKNVDQQNKYFYKRTLVPMTLFLVFCISIATAIKGLQSNEVVAEKVLLEPDEVYSQYDVTGDGEADNIKVEIVDKQDQSFNGMIKIFLNDEIIFEQTREGRPYWNVELIKLANGKVFFDIDSTVMDDDHVHQLYVFENDTLKSVYDFQEYYDEYTSNYSVEIVKVSGNTIVTEVRAQFYVTGIIQYDMNLNYKDEKFEKTSNEFILKYETMSRENKWTANKTIKVYAQIGSKNIAYILKKGNIVKLNKVIYKNEEVYFQIEDDMGNTGYIIATKIYTDMNYFQEAEYEKMVGQPLNEEIRKKMEKNIEVK